MSEIEKENYNTSLFKRWYVIFKTCNLPQKAKLDPISKWLIITRSCVISMTIIAGIIGGLLAIPQGSINWLNWLLSVVGIILAHWSNNMINDFFDLKQGVDTDEYARALYAPHPILSGIISKKRLVITIFVLNLLDAFILVYFMTTVDWRVMFFALNGLAISVFYVAPPINLKKRGLGEPAVFLIWGPLMICGTYFVTT